MVDYAHDQTDKLIAQAEKRLRKEYLQASKEVKDKLDDYLRRFEKKDKKWREWVQRGVKTDAQYKAWRAQQILAGKRWAALQEQLAIRYHKANQQAGEIVTDTKAKAYALNFNFSAYQIEKELGIEANFAVVDDDVVRMIITEDPDILPPPGKKVSQRIAEGKDIRWNKQVIQSVAMQGILQGESIPEIARMLAEEVGDKNYKAAIRNARTMVTYAENAGRMDSSKRAQKMGIEIQHIWNAVHDGRTRHEHRMLDGQVVDVGEPFKVDGYELDMPGDPKAPGYLIYNCRCRMSRIISGHPIDVWKYGFDSETDYKKWLSEKPKHFKPIDAQAKTAARMKAKYTREYMTK